MGLLGMGWGNRWGCFGMGWGMVSTKGIGWEGLGVRGEWERGIDGESNDVLDVMLLLCVHLHAHTHTHTRTHTHTCRFPFICTSIWS